MRFQNCEFCENCDFQYVNFWIKCGFLPQCEKMRTLGWFCNIVCPFSRGFIGVVSQPSTFSSLELGYVCTPNGRCLPVQEVDLPLWQHGEGGQDPKDFAFRFADFLFSILFRARWFFFCFFSIFVSLSSQFRFKVEEEWHQMQVSIFCKQRIVEKIQLWIFCGSKQKKNFKVVTEERWYFSEF